MSNRFRSDVNYYIQYHNVCSGGTEIPMKAKERARIYSLRESVPRG